MHSATSAHREQQCQAHTCGSIIGAGEVEVPVGAISLLLLWQHQHAELKAFDGELKAILLQPRE